MQVLRQPDPAGVNTDHQGLVDPPYLQQGRQVVAHAADTGLDLGGGFPDVSVAHVFQGVSTFETLELHPL